MLVAITGGTGFIGSELVNHHLKRGDRIRLLSRYPERVMEHDDAIEWYQGDLTENRGLEAFVDGIDVLYHCAGQLTDSSAMRALHVDGTQHLIDAASGRIKYWVQLSSVGVYGPVRSGEVTEQSELNPVGCYEETKTESDLLLIDQAEKAGFSYAILRPSNVFGDKMSNQSLFGMIRMIERGAFFFIGKPGASANYIHVENVVEGLVLCATNPAAKGGIYNLSDHRPMEQFVSVIADALGRKKPGIRMPELPVRMAARLLGAMPGFPLTPARVDALSNRSIYSIKRIKDELGYMHVTSMEEGLRSLVAAYQVKP